MVANILPTDTPSTQGVGSKGQTISFSESGHVAYQIKGNRAQSTMKANMLSLHTPMTPGGRGKRSFFFSKSGHAAYQIPQCKVIPGRVAQSVTCLATDGRLTADSGVESSILARSHTFVEIDHEIISTVILLPSAVSFKKGCCQLQGKVCARSTG